MTLEEIEDLLVERVAEVLYLHPADIDPSKPHSSYGLDSASALVLAAELEEEFGIPLPDSLAYEFETLRCLAEHIAKELEEAGR